MKTPLQRSIHLLVLAGLWIIGCQKISEPDPVITSFTVTAKVITGVADLKPNNYVNDVNLTWTRAKIINCDSITYTVLYRDTLVRKLTDTTFIIHNVGNNTTATGLVIARTNKGITTSSPFSINSGIAPRFRIKKWSRSSVSLKYDNYTAYTYDSLGRLASYYDFTGKHYRGQTTILKYDQLGRLISINGLPNGDNTGAFEIYLTTYEYDLKGNPGLVRTFYSTYQKLPLELKREVYFEYNDANLPIKATYTGSSYTTIYTYGNSNMIQIEQSDNQGNKNGPYIYQYGRSPNPFYGLLGYTEFSAMNVTYSQNNVIGLKGTITYDSNGLMKTRNNENNDSYETFEYESY